MSFPMGLITRAQGIRPPGAWNRLLDHASSTSDHRMSFPSVLQPASWAREGHFPTLFFWVDPELPSYTPLDPLLLRDGWWRVGANRAWMCSLSWPHEGMRSCWAELSGKKKWGDHGVLAPAPQMLGEGLTESKLSLDPRQRPDKAIKLKTGGMG